jgi:hypothetical protein
LPPLVVSEIRRPLPIAVIPSDRAVGRAQDHGRLVPMRGRIGRALDGLARQVLEAS